LFLGLSAILLSKYVGKEIQFHCSFFDPKDALTLQERALFSFMQNHAISLLISRPIFKGMSFTPWSMRFSVNTNNFFVTAQVFDH
jgi:hypothetical protein